MVVPFMVLDKHAKETGGEYTVKSIYFDTPDLECYYQKLAGVKRRNKVRMRGYNKGEFGARVFFEIKKKVDEPLTKHRAPLEFETALKILRGEPINGLIVPDAKFPKAIENVQRFMYHILSRRMRPVVNVIYEREPYQALFKDPENDLRITFDKNLRAVADPELDQLFYEDYPILVNGKHFIMEVKFNHYLPGWVKAIIASIGLKKGPASKYVLCMDAVKNKAGLNHKISLGDWAAFKIKEKEDGRMGENNIRINY